MKKWLIIILVVYILVMTSIAYDRHTSFYSGEDLAVNEGIMSNSINGRFLYNPSTLSNQFEVHFNFIIIILLPLYYVFNNTLLLLFLQIFAIAIGVIPLYRLSEHLLKDEYKGLIPYIILTYLLFPTIIYSALIDFHPMLLAVPMLLSIFLFIEEDKPFWTYIFAVLMLSIKEDLSITLLAVGIYAYLIKRKTPQKKTGLNLIIISSGYLIIMGLIKALFIPKFWSEIFLLFYQYLGTDIPGIIHSIITKPIYALTYEPIKYKFLYILFYLKNLSLLPLLSSASLISLPIIIESIYSQSVNSCPNYYHSILLVPILIYASIKSFKIIGSKKILTILLIISILQGTVFFYSYLNKDNESLNQQYFSGKRCFYNYYKFGAGNIREANAESLLVQIPKASSVATCGYMAPHLIGREVYYLDFYLLYHNLGIETPKADYLLYNLKDCNTDKLRITEKYVAINHIGNLYLMRRR